MRPSLTRLTRFFLFSLLLRGEFYKLAYTPYVALKRVRRVRRWPRLARPQTDGLGLSPELDDTVEVARERAAGAGQWTVETTHTTNDKRSRKNTTPTSIPVT
jgi:hypothetical protein